MKKYWVHYYKNFSNTYHLYYTENKEEEKLLPEGAYLISRKYAQLLAVCEKERKKDNPTFSGYADDKIYPVTYDRNITDWKNKKYRLDHNILLRV